MEGAREGGLEGGEGRVGVAGPWMDAAFAVGAAVALALLGWFLVAIEPFGVGLVDAPVAGKLPEWGAAALGVWMGCVGVVALVLPGLALVGWGRYPSVRLALLPYVSVLGFQILLEMLLAVAIAPNLVVLVGLVFTGYRLRQLQIARRIFAGAHGPSGTGRAVVGRVLSLGLLFWSVNLIFLASVALPRVVQVS